MLAMTEDILDNRSFDPYEEGWPSIEDSYIIYSDLGAEIECENLLSVVDCDVTKSPTHVCSNTTVPSVSSSVASSECSDLDTMGYDDLFTCKNETDVIRTLNEECLPDSQLAFLRSNDCHATEQEWRNFSEAYVEHFETVKWSRMTSDHQVEVLQEITQIVSQKLGLREQLELIKLICPDADVSPADDEFFIDLDLFNDSNFAKVCTFVRNELNSINGSAQRQRFGAPKLGRRKRQRNTAGKPSKRNLKTQSDWPQRRKTAVKAKSITKNNKQVRKEKQSGLFSNEEVISIPKKDDDGDDDIEIDILD